MWKALRIAVLLFILATVAQTTWMARRDATDWNNPLTVVLYPINGDGSDVAGRHVAALGLERFQAMSSFMREQAAAHGVAIAEPIELRLAPRVDALPPAPPRGGNVLEVMAWSLRLRFWVWQHDTYQGARANVRLFLLYHDDRTSPRLAHSTGLEKGLIGVVNLFASEDMSRENNVIIMHELLHTLGATDKYDPASNQPRYPEGYAEPDLQPRWPQRYAEIMGGRIPMSAVRAEQADGLERVLIGPLTAREINWTSR